MKTVTAFAIALTFLAGTAALGVESAYAFGGERNGERGMRGGEAGQMMHGQGMHKGMRGGENALVPQEMHEEWRAEHRAEIEAMTDEEREAYFEERHGERTQHRAERHEAMENFTGLTHEEMHELRADGETMSDVLEGQGITEAEAEEFLTEQANEKVDDIVERHDLSDEDENTLRDRVAAFVQSMLDRWFG